MNNKDFVHLHTHDEFSLLDGYGSANMWAERASELGFTHIAFTNHGNVDGLIRSQNALREVGIKLICGCEAYMVPDIMAREKGERRYHVTLLVKNAVGWKNLLQVLTKANLQGFYYRPRIDPSILLDHSEGLIIMTACASSFLHMPGSDWLLTELIQRTEVVGEIMPLILEATCETNDLVLQTAIDYGINLVATNDCHYPLAEDSKLQEVLLAMQRKDKWSNPDRWKFDIDDLYLKTADEMIESFKIQNQIDEKICTEAMWNTMAVAKLCDFEIESRKPHLPKAYIEKYDDLAEEDQLVSLVMDGLGKRAEDHGWIRDGIKDYESRIEEELAQIMPQFTRYFLVVWELVHWCEKEDIMVGPGRGSSSGSLVAYCLGITNIDPIKYKLIFSRFISVGRIDLPDIDLDFEDRRRDDVKQHLADIYGKWNVIEISTFLRMHGRGAIRDVSRVFDVPLFEVGKAAECIVTRCLDGNTEVWTIDGPTPIKYLVGEKDFKVTGWFGNRRVKRTVSEVFENDEKDMFEMELESGKKIICSKDHFFWSEFEYIYRGKKCKKIGWRKLKNLNLETDEIQTVEFNEAFSHCKWCYNVIYKNRCTDREFCSLSCLTTYRNTHDNPMLNPETKAKMTDTKSGIKPKWMDDDEKLLSFKNKTAHRLRINNPMKNPKTRRKQIRALRKVMPEVNNRAEKVEKQRAYMLKRLEENPESHPLRILAKNPRKGVSAISFPQARLTKIASVIASSYGFEIEAEWPVGYYKRGKRKTKRHYYLDIAILELKIDIEYDGALHKNLKRSDSERDLLLKSKGWNVFRFTKRDFSGVGEIENKIERIMSNAIRKNSINKANR